MARNEESRFDLMEEFRRGVKFNKNSLDDDLMEQPVMFEKVASLLAASESDVKDIKAEIDTAEAELFIQFKDKYAEEASDEDKKKPPSEGYIKAKVEVSKRMQKLKNRLSTAERRMRELSALKESYQQRSRSIHEEVALYEAQYWEKDSGGKRGEVRDRKADRARIEAGRKRERRHEDDDE